MMARDIKRRSFLKYSAAGAASVALSQLLGQSLLADSKADRPFVDRCTGKKVEGLVTTCAGCGAGCGMLAYVRSGELIKLAGNPAHPTSKGRLCLVGQAGIYTLYDPERVTKPMVRAGNRGQNRWKEISWDEASSMLAGRIKGRGKGGLVVETMGGPAARACGEFAQKLGGRVVKHSYVVSPGREAALSGTFGAPYDVPDIAGTDYILNFGADPYESDPFGVVTVAALTEARARGGAVRLVTFDPRLSQTAGRSDEWHPLAPGSEASVALAMAKVIMDEGLYDKAFIEKYTNTTPASISAHVAKFSPDMAGNRSGIKAAEIKRIALEYARADRAVVMTGPSVSMHISGTDNERAVRLLAIITGKVDRPGCNMTPKIYPAGPGVDTLVPDAFHKKMVDGAEKVGVYIVHGCDPVYSSPETAQMARVLSDEAAVPFIVCMDTHVTDTGLMADMVLPLTTYLEEYGVECSPGAGGSQVIGYRQPVVMAKDECRPAVEALADIAARAGAMLSYEDSQGYAEMVASGYDGLAKGGNLDDFEKKGFFVTPRQSGRGPYETKSGKIELAWAGALPGYSRQAGVEDSRPGELVLVKYSPSAYREGVTENNLYLREIFHENRAFINRAAGEKLGLKTWDRVRLVNELGKLEVTVVLSPGIHPTVVAIAGGCGHAGYGNIEKGKRFESADPFTEVIWWGKEGNGVNTNSITPFNLDPRSGGQGWMHTRVTLEKA